MMYLGQIIENFYQLRALFQNAVFIAVTATATLSTRKEMCTSLGMANAAVVSMNPDRTNNL